MALINSGQQVIELGLIVLEQLGVPAVKRTAWKNIMDTFMQETTKASEPTPRVTDLDRQIAMERG